MRTNFVIPSEATHRPLDLLEKPPLLVTFDQSFEQKTGPHYSPSGSSLEFEVVVVLTQDRVFMSIVGPSGCGKTELLFRMLKGSTFYPRFEKISKFYK